MKKQDIVIGKTYAIRFHDGKLTPVTILKALPAEPWHNHQRYQARNENTQRLITIKSPARLRYEVVPSPFKPGAWVTVPKD